MLQARGKHSKTEECLHMTSFFVNRFCLQANRGSTCELTSILGHFWPMRVPVHLNFAKVCVNFSAAVCLFVVSN